MQSTPGEGLVREVRETFALLGIVATMLGSYLGLALVLLRAVA